jgi:hypothetical protein
VEVGVGMGLQPIVFSFGAAAKTLRKEEAYFNMLLHSFKNIRYCFVLINCSKFTMLDF